MPFYGSIFIYKQFYVSGLQMKKDLFTISQVSKSCSISRASIMRLEKRGLLIPAYTNKKTGYRHYDNHNISLIMQIQYFLEMGLSYDDIALYIRSNGTSAQILKKLEYRLEALKRAYKEVEMRISDTEEFSFEFIDLPEVTCYCRDFNDTAPGKRYDGMYSTYHEVVEKGYELLCSEPLFTINIQDDLFEADTENKECAFTCCVPLKPQDPPEDAVVIPACHAFSLLWAGGYDNRNEAYAKLYNEIKRLGLKLTGHSRALGLVAPYTRRNIAPKNFITRLAVPIEDSP